MNMENFILTIKTKELEEKSGELGFSKTLFFGTDFVVLEGTNKKEILVGIQKAKGKKQQVVYLAKDEETLRFVVEKTGADIVLGVERIHPKDSVHYLRSGLDQVLCSLAAKRDIAFGFSFVEILNSMHRPKLLGRMMANIQLCKKYNVRMVFSTFASDPWELRSAADLNALWRVLEKKE